MNIFRSRLSLVFLALGLAIASLALLALLAFWSMPASSHGNVVVAECNVVGTGGDTASLRGIVFTANQSFTAIEVRMDGAAPGIYSATAEIRRSGGFTAPLLAASRVTATLPGTPDTTPYPVVHFDLPPITVSDSETFSLKFTEVLGPDTLYFEMPGIGNLPCPGVMETVENNVATPTERSDPTGLRVLALREVQWGDVDCSGGVDAIDALKVLRHVAALSVSKTEPCPVMGAMVQP